MIEPPETGFVPEMARVPAWTDNAPSFVNVLPNAELVRPPRVRVPEAATCRLEAPAVTFSEFTVALPPDSEMPPAVFTSTHTSSVGPGNRWVLEPVSFQLPGSSQLVETSPVHAMVGEPVQGVARADPVPRTKTSPTTPNRTAPTSAHRRHAVIPDPPFNAVLARSPSEQAMQSRFGAPYAIPSGIADKCRLKRSFQEDRTPGTCLVYVTCNTKPVCFRPRSVLNAR